jgi:hypothetical protein
MPDVLVIANATGMELNTCSKNAFSLFSSEALPWLSLKSIIMAITFSL